MMIELCPRHSLGFTGERSPRLRRLWLAPLPHRAALDIRCGAGAREPAPGIARRGFVRFPGNRIQKAVVEALVPGALEPVPEADTAAGWTHRFEFATRGSRDRLSGAIGFRAPAAASAVEPLPADPVLLKLQFALWSRYFAQDGELGGTVSTSVSQLCDDLGYARLRNGAHRPAVKRRVEALLKQLAALELDVEYRAPNGRTCRLQGVVWALSLSGPGSRTVTFAPGPWSREAVWTRFNAQVALAGEGLLRLRADRDAWAVYLGGYLASIARMNGYRPKVVRLHTLLVRSGLLWAERRNPARMREKLERALERLEAAGVLGGWDWLAVEADEPDMDAPARLASLADAENDWPDRRLVIRWPGELERRAEQLGPQASPKSSRSTGKRRRGSEAPYPPR